MIFTTYTNAKYTLGTRRFKLFRYELIDDYMTPLRLELEGSFPSEDEFIVNTRCRTTIFIYEGHGELIGEKHRYDLHIGDNVFMEEGEPFRLQGHMKIFMATTPKWYPEQQKLLLDLQH